MYNWNKLGRIFNPEDVKEISWMKQFAQSPSALIFENFIRVYFSCRPLPDQKGQYVSYTGFVDLDRFNLFKIINISKEPILKLGKLGTFDEFGTYPASIIRHGSEVRVYYAGWTRCESVPFNAAIGVGISKNGGETFEKVGDGPVLSFSLDEPFVLGSPRIRFFDKHWYLWYVSGKKWIKDHNRPEPVYKIRMAVSKDGFNWEKFGKDIIESNLEENECQACPDVIFKNGSYHMFFSYRHNLDFKIASRGYRIGYACSKNLKKWERDDSKAGINVSESGWDSETVSYPHIFELDNKIYMLYQGNQIGKSGFGLAVLNGTL